MTEDRLTQTQFSQLVGEVERLSRLRSEELDREQIQQILQELNLPTDLVDEAMMQLRRREVLAVQQKRQKWIIGGIVAGLVVAIAAGTIWFQSQQKGVNNIYANSEQSHLTINTDSGTKMLNAIERQQNPEVFYRVILQDAPVGKKLSLGCNWINPNGDITHQNRYETKEISKEVWPTYCRYQFNPDLPVGSWRVEMYLGDRLLSQTKFTVK